MEPSPLSAQESELLQKGRLDFDTGRYWHAHEAWEDLWNALKQRNAAKDEILLIQGLIQTAALLYNHQRKKSRGVRNQWEKLVPKLAPWFVVFAQTPKAQDQSRRLFLRYAAFLMTPVLGIIVFRTIVLSLILACAFGVLLGLGWREWKRWQQMPFAVNPPHPMMELDSDKDAEVMIRLMDGRWVKAGQDRYRLIADDLLSGFNLVATDEDYTILGYFTESKTIDSNLRRTMALLNQSLALRDAHNNLEDDIEHARQREALDYGLLEREWPEEMELEDAAGPIAKKLMGQE